MQKYDVVLPESVIALIDAVRRDDPGRPLDDVMAAIIGALPFLAAALYARMSEDDYRYFREIVKLWMGDARRVINAQDPSAALQQWLILLRDRGAARGAPVSTTRWWDVVYGD